MHTCELCSTTYRNTTSSLLSLTAECSGYLVLLLNMWYKNCADICTKSSLVKSSYKILKT